MSDDLELEDLGRDEVAEADPRPGIAVAPHLADGCWRPLDPRAVAVERLGAWIAVAVVTLPLVAGTLLTELLAPLPGWLGFLLPVLVMALLTGLGWLAHRWPAIAYRRRAWRLDRDRFEIRRGVVWRQVISVPRSRVQHTDVAQGPIERGHGLARLVVHTAGTAGASVTLEGLALATAEAVRDHLVAHERADGR